MQRGSSFETFWWKRCYTTQTRLEWSGGGRDVAIWFESRTGTYIIYVWYFSAESHFSIIGCSSSTLLSGAAILNSLFIRERERGGHEELTEMVC